MRLSEFVNLRENATAGATGSGSIATVAAPLGGTISRNGGSFFSGAKYTNDATPNTPAEYKKWKKRKK